MYKCCWNCSHAVRIDAIDKERRELLDATVRACCVPTPVSNRLEDPYKQRYCRQFSPAKDFPVSGREVTKREAIKFKDMYGFYIARYWRENHE